MPTIRVQKNGEFYKEDCLALATLLVKAGYTVRLGKALQTPGKPGKTVRTVEYIGDMEKWEDQV